MDLSNSVNSVCNPIQAVIEDNKFKLKKNLYNEWIGYPKWIYPREYCRFIKQKNKDQNYEDVINQAEIN